MPKCRGINKVLQRESFISFGHRRDYIKDGLFFPEIKLKYIY
jgi:hypothetical protein